jgi:SAM-dependent MidA family methyltransferase
VVPASPEVAAAADHVAADVAVPDGARLPVPTATVDWVAECGRVLRRGCLVVLDYADSAASLATRPQHEWLRTFRGHQRGGSPLDAPGSQDVTATVPVEHLVTHATRAGFRLVEQTAQTEWLGALGIDDLVDDARGLWRERAAIGDLEALAARSRVTEAAALTDPSGLGAHAVFVFAKG